MGDQTTDDAEHTAGPSEQPEAAPPGPPPGPKPGPLASMLRSRGMRWGSATAVYVVVVVAILVAVNFVGSRFQAQLDLTASDLYTLHPASKDLVAKLKQPVTIIAFIQPGSTTDYSQQIKILLEQYKKYSDGHISYQIVNPVADPGLANEYGITTSGSVVVKSSSGPQVVQASSMVTYNNQGQAIFDGEGPIDDAIIRATTVKTYTVDFLVGDGEPDPANGALSGAESALTDQGYTASTLDLFTTASVPKTLSALIIDDPTNDLSTTEVNAINAYAEAGGHVMVLLNPTAKPLPNLDAMLASWGATPQNNIVVDTANNYQGTPEIIIPNYPGSSITDPLQSGNIATLLPGVQGFTIGKTKNVVTPLLQSSSSTGSIPTSWGMSLATAEKSTGTPPYNPKTDIKGPIDLAVTIEGPQPASAASSTSSTSGIAGSSSGSASNSSSASSSTGAASYTSSTSAAGPTLPASFRAVLIGDAAFISSGQQTGGTSYISLAGNEDLFLNSVGWLTGRAQGISIQPNSATNSQVIISASLERVLVDVFVFAIPIVLLLIALGTYMARRRL